MDDMNNEKITLRDRIENLFQKFVQIFSEYPFTLGAIILVGLIYAIEFDDMSMLAERIVFFLLVFSAGSLFTEEMCRGQINIFGKDISRNTFRAVGLFISGLFSLFVVWFMDLTERLYKTESDPTILGIKVEYCEEVIAKLLTFIIPVLILFAVYGMYKKSGASFKKYCIGVFSQTMKVSLIYLIFAIGIAIIYGIFDVLIFTLDYDILIRLEIILFVAIYVPALIKAFSSIKEEIGKFAKVVVLYALFVLLLAAFAIIYLYIIRILSDGEFPSNEVFNILSWLFALGAPIWTMAMNFDDEILGKISRKMPFVFIPCIILQMICIGIRVATYGITVNRYMAIALIIFEIIYLVIFALSKGEQVERVVFAVPVMLFVIIWMPVINASSCTVLSQGARLEKIWESKDGLSAKEQSEARQIYNEIYYSGMRGHMYLEQHFTKAEIEEIESFEWYYYDSDYNRPVMKYYSWGQSNYRMTMYDISDYSAMTVVDKSYYDKDDYLLEIDDGNGDAIIYDIKEQMEAFIEDEDEYFIYNNPIKVADDTYLWVDHISLNTRDGEMDYLYIQGIMFYK